MTSTAASYTIEIAYHVVCWEKTKLGHVGTKVGEFLCKDAAAREVKRLNGKTMIDFSAVLKDFSRRTGVSAESILGSSRREDIVAARHLLWHLLRDYGGATFAGIAEHFDATHPAILHGVKSVREKLEVGDKLVCEMWELVEDMEV